MFLTILWVSSLWSLTGGSIIPENILECYQRPVPLAPLTITTFIEILQKVEESPMMYLDMAALAESLLRRFWWEGIERNPDATFGGDKVIPYSPTGFQTYKFRLLKEKLLKGTGEVFPDDSISLSERCTLHAILSSSVDVWERGDEFKLCPSLPEQKQKDTFQFFGSKKSSCPRELGVMKVGQYGTVSGGKVVYAIAAALLPIQINQALLAPSYVGKLVHPLSKIIDNVWAGTVAGELAEALVLQSTFPGSPFIGPSGSWNDSLAPTEYYLKATPTQIANGFWHISDAEALGAFDGVILAQVVSSLLPKFYSLRLSQVLEMYYSEFMSDIETQACLRKKEFFDLLLVKQTDILQQTQFFAEVLSVITPHYFLDEKFISDKKLKFLNAFKDRLSDLISDNHLCSAAKVAPPKVQLQVIYDGTWRDYQFLQFLMKLCELIDVSKYGSSISVINGQTGEVIVDRVSTLSDTYLVWKEAPSHAKDVSYLDLSRSLIPIKDGLENSTEAGQWAWVTLIVALSSTQSDRSLDIANGLLKSIRAFRPEMGFHILTDEVHSASFRPLTREHGFSHDSLIVLSNKDLEDAARRAKLAILEVPRSIRPVTCYGRQVKSSFEREEYISPNISYKYIIHPDYMCGSEKVVHVQFVGRGYGSLTVCLSDPERNCTQVPEWEAAEFNITKECESDSKESDSIGPICPPASFSVKGRDTMNMCRETDCRFPGQIRFLIRVRGLNCLKNNQVTCSSSSIGLPVMLIMTSLVFHILCYT